MTNSTRIIEQTQYWISQFIIQHNICPFAKQVFERDSIHYEVVISEKLENQLQELIYSCEQLDRESGVETSLLITPNGLSEFDDFLDFLELANNLIYQQGYEGIYQLASFHPNYCFDGVETSDASNFTNRSPYPMLHLIRESSIEKALKNYPKPESIPIRNIEYTKKIGAKALKELLNNCCR